MFKEHEELLRSQLHLKDEIKLAAADRVTKYLFQNF